MYSFVSGCCTAYCEYLFALLILSQALHTSVSGNDLSGCVCGTGVMVLVFRLIVQMALSTLSASWLFFRKHRSTFIHRRRVSGPSPDTFAHTWSVLHFRNNACFSGCCLPRNWRLRCVLGRGCQRWWPREASSTFAEKNSQKLVVHLMVSND